MTNPLSGSSAPAPLKPQMKKIRKIVHVKNNTVENFGSEMFKLDMNTWIMIFLGSLAFAYLLGSDLKKRFK